MQASCRGRCFSEKINRFKINRYYSNPEEYKRNLPKIPKTCRQCGYSILSDRIRCYCCTNKYSTSILGNSRKQTIAVMVECRRRVRDGSL